MTRQPDLLVVGAGVVGAACAMYAAESGLRVVVLERDLPAGGVTSAGMGHIVAMDDSPAQLALTAYSRGLLAGLAAELPPSVEYDRCGTIWVAATGEELEGARGKCALYHAHGLHAELLDARALTLAEPSLRRDLAGGVLIPEDGVLYQPAFTRWLLDRARRAGAVVQSGVTVRALSRHGVQTSAGPMASGATLIAAGTDTSALLPRLPIIPRKGHLAVTARVPGMVRHQLVELGYLQSAHAMTASSVAFNVQPRRTGQLLIGSSRELVGPDRSMNHDVLGQMLSRAVAFMPALASVDVLRVWTGLRPATPDGLPFIGRVPEREGVWVAAGHEGLGITTALGTGAITAALLTGSGPSIDAAPFTPDRIAEPAGASHG
ncbi:MAG TPA: FAD-dependent oxidoreductase [Gemmatimonadales bacterium]|nr:FAD-dependent oxidoreductase [Gemmatimonadales bacterium]